MKLLSGDEARRAGLKFLQGIYYRGTISVEAVTLETGGASPEYRLEGKITTACRNPLGRLTSDEIYDTFKLRLHAVEGTILGYEVR